MESAVTFLSEGQQVVGMLHAPEGGGERRPAVLFLHGFTGAKPETKRLFVQAARALAREGMISLRFDFRGSGDSEGEFVDVTLAGEIADARAALRFLRDQANVDPARVAVVAMSMGGLVGAFVIAEDPGLKTAVLWAPVGHPDQLVKRRESSVLSLGQAALQGYFDYEGWPVGLGLVRELGNLKPIEALARCRAPVLLMHGEKDEIVPVTDSQDYESALRDAGGTVKLRVIHGADHNFSTVPWQKDLLSHTVSWLRKGLKIG